MKNCTLLLLLIVSLQLNATPGQLDPAFGNFGTALGPFLSQLNVNHYITQQANGKLLATGYQRVNGNDNMFVMRYNTDGTFDSNFGINGVIADSASTLIDIGWAAIEQPDGKILVTGTIEQPSFTRDIFVKRYDSTGVLDTTFGVGGVSVIDFANNSDEIPFDIKIQSDGKIVICGATASGLQSDAMLLRYNTDGSLDSTFGIGGKVSTNIGVTSQRAHSMVLQPDGRIVIAGETDDPSAGHDLLVVRYKTNGNADSSFASSGIYRFDIALTDDELFSIALQTDGKIIAAGTTNDLSGFEDDLIIRLDTSGHIDSTFNNTGILIKDYNGSDNRIKTVMIQSDGKIVTAGSQFASTNDISLSRYHADGSVDSTFGLSGHITHTIGIEEETVNSALLQHDNKLVVTGSYTDSGLQNVFTSRYLNDSLQTSISKVYASDFNLYPQPATSILMLRDFPKHAKYFISDLNGRIIISESDVTSTIDISELESGIYFIRLIFPEGELVRKFVKI